MNVEDLKKLLISVGFPSDKINLFVSQVAFETGSLSFNSEVATVDNNLSGIKYNSITPFWRKKTNATIGSISSEGDPYAHFQTVRDWAICYRGFLEYGSKPIQSDSISELARKLKQNAYYQSDETLYRNGMQRFYSQLT